MYKIIITLLLVTFLLTGCTAIVEDYKQRRDAPEIARQKRQQAYTAKLELTRKNFTTRGLTNHYDKAESFNKAINDIQRGYMHAGDHFQLEHTLFNVFQAVGNNQYLAHVPAHYYSGGFESSIAITLTTDHLCFEGNNMGTCLHPSLILRYDGLGTYNTAIKTTKQTLYFTAIK